MPSKHLHLAKPRHFCPVKKRKEKDPSKLLPSQVEAVQRCEENDRERKDPRLDSSSKLAVALYHKSTTRGCLYLHHACTVGENLGLQLPWSESLHGLQQRRARASEEAAHEPRKLMGCSFLQCLYKTMVSAGRRGG